MELVICYCLIKKDKYIGVCLGELIIFYGIFLILMFMLVGIFVIVKIMLLEELKEMGVGVILSNIYYLWLCLGEDLVEEVGGLYKFMNWD